MADISMCRGVNCPVKDKCYRFTATPNKYRQPYRNHTFKDGECDYFLKTKSRK